MLRTIGKVGSAVIDALLPGTRAEACTPPFCEGRTHNGVRQHRCCMLCTGNVKSCGGWTTGACTSSSC
jgi:hypothetical protein